MAVFQYLKHENNINSINKNKIKINVGGDKSITHRAYFLAAIANGKSIIYNPSNALDCNTTLNALSNLGISFNFNLKDKSISINGNDFQFNEPENIIDCQNSGTTARLLIGLLSSVKTGMYFLTGDSSLIKRPMQRVVYHLKKLGANVYLRQNNYLPALILGQKLAGDYEFINETNSAQVKSALILSALNSDVTLTINELIKTRNHLELMASHFGVDLKIIDNKTQYKIIINGPQKLKSAKIFIPNDISSAANFITLDALTYILYNQKLNILIPKVVVNSTRNGFLKILEQIGIVIKYTNYDKNTYIEPVCDISIDYDKINDIKPIKINLLEQIVSMIDEIPLLALILCFANGKSVISNLSELKIKESNRLLAIKTELNKMGANIEIKNDTLIINNVKKLYGTKLNSYNDHRIAMMLIIAGIISNSNFYVSNCESIKVSNPNFFKLLKKLSFKFHILKNNFN